MLAHGLSRVFPTEPKISLPRFPYHNRISQPICFSLFRHQACSNADQETSIGQLRQPQSFRVQWLARAGQGESLPGFLKALPWAAIPARVKFRAAKGSSSLFPRRWHFQQSKSVFPSIQILFLEYHPYGSRNQPNCYYRHDCQSLLENQRRY